ncbi:MAG: hypothetical protein ONB46_18190 [candidate division KSB1 bacterium]|nr:hypothetical protein [candidate division KSB1 bacterium]MDZ7367770.1 hypothetical protein [candidate division KSB1 bacterium]MDZ7406639.1 hypothetical protein [candidate division KSB1 bacterium]
MPNTFNAHHGVVSRRRSTNGCNSSTTRPNCCRPKYSALKPSRMAPASSSMPAAVKCSNAAQSSLIKRMNSLPGKTPVSSQAGMGVTLQIFAQGRAVA